MVREAVAGTLIPWSETLRLVVDRKADLLTLGEE